VQTLQVFASQAFNSVFRKNHNFSEKSFKNLLTNKCFSCNVRLMNDTLRPFREGRIMKDELRSESQAEICWGRPARRSRCGEGGKIREIPFFCPTYLSAIPSHWPRTVHRSQSESK
jgi:hypothetical protein